MSTRLAEGEQSTILREEVLCVKRRRFVRSSSIDKIKQFNSYICSQNYFILPSLIAWLKTSHSLFQAHHEQKKKNPSAAIILASFVFRTLLEQLKVFIALLAYTGRKFHYRISHSALAETVEMLLLIGYHGLNVALAEVQRKLLIVSVYLTFFAIFLQLGTCIFLLSEVFLPVGLIFLFVCMYLISHLNVRVLFHYLRKEESKLNGRERERKAGKFVLGKRTISNFNLF